MWRCDPSSGSWHNFAGIPVIVGIPGESRGCLFLCAGAVISTFLLGKWYPIVNKFQKTACGDPKGVPRWPKGAQGSPQRSKRAKTELMEIIFHEKYIMVTQPKGIKSSIHQWKQWKIHAQDFVGDVLPTTLLTETLISSHGPYGQFGTTTLVYPSKKTVASTPNKTKVGNETTHIYSILIERWNSKTKRNLISCHKRWTFGCLIRPISSRQYDVDFVISLNG